MSDADTVYVLERDFGYEGIDRVSIHRTLRGAVMASDVPEQQWNSIGGMWEAPDPGASDGFQIQRETVEP